MRGVRGVPGERGVELPRGDGDADRARLADNGGSMSSGGFMVMTRGLLERSMRGLLEEACGDLPADASANAASSGDAASVSMWTPGFGSLRAVRFGPASFM